MKTELDISKIVISKKVGQWCRIPYPNHPKGCPNYRKKDTCPPGAPDLESFFEIQKPMYMIFHDFDLSEHAARMKAKHPHWSDRQCRCVLYWQNSSRKKLREKAHLYMMQQRLNAITLCPEGMGMNVYATAMRHGVRLEKIRDLSICRHVAVIGYRKSGS